MQTEEKRLNFLDGIRGWGAISVLLYHVLVQAFPISKEISVALRKFPLFNGELAVWIFFVISGFSLSIGFIQNSSFRTLRRIAAGRYFRLAIPVLAAALFIKFLFVIGAIPAVESRPSVFRIHLLSEPSLLDTVVMATYDTFFRFTLATSMIPPIWTMNFEFWGSFLVIMMLFATGRSKLRIPAYLAVAFFGFCINPIYTAFVVGVIFAEIYYRVPEISVPAAICIFVGLVIAYHLPFYSAESERLYLVGSAVLTFGFIFQPKSASFFSGKASRFLGKISFPLYLTHSSMLFAVGINSYLEVGQDVSIALRVAIDILVISAAISVSICFVPVDRFSVLTSKWIASRLVNDEERKGGPA